MVPNPCNDDLVALKSFFLGPRAENAPWLSLVVHELVTTWTQWRISRYPHDGSAISIADQQTPAFRKRQEEFLTKLRDVMRLFESEIPKFSPRYIGHMFSEISIPALLGHFVTLLHNPNNVSEESSRVGRRLEEEAIAMLTKMLGFEHAHGHFTSGGTVANFEAVLRARERTYLWLALAACLREKGVSDASYFQGAHMGWETFDTSVKTHSVTIEDIKKKNVLARGAFQLCQELTTTFGKAFSGPVLLVPKHRHYSWQKAAHYFGLGENDLWAVSLNSRGAMCTEDLEKNIRAAHAADRPILAVVSVVGTTELGNIDDVGAINTLLSKLRKEEDIHIWHHIDAAYGAFFAAMQRDASGKKVLSETLSDTAQRALASIPDANSVTLDPHKLAYVPYSSGTIIVRDQREYDCFNVDAPYIALDEKNRIGKQTMEGSRSAAGAVATWLTGKSIGFNNVGYGPILDRTIKQKRGLELLLRNLANDIFCFESTDTNICCFAVAREGDSLRTINSRALNLYDHFSGQGDADFFVSKTTVSLKDYEGFLSKFLTEKLVKRDSENLHLIRLCLMNPFFSTKETQVKFPEAFVEALQSFLKQQE